MDKRVLNEQETTCDSEWGTLRLEEYNIWYIVEECAQSNPVLNIHKWFGQNNKRFD